MLTLIATVMAGVEDPTLRAMMVALRPDVERLTGRGFETLPRVRTVNRATLDAVLSQRPWYLPPELWTPARAREHAADVDAGLAYAVAVYNPPDDTIYVLEAEEAEDTIERALAERDLSGVIAHEMTHALQARHLSTSLEADLPGVLVEGQARMVQRVITGAGTLGVSELRGYGSLANLDPTDTLVYTYEYGARFAETYTRQHGSDALWWLIDHAAPTREEVLAVVGATLPSGWIDFRPVAARLAQGFELSPIAVHGGPASPYPFIAGASRPGASLLKRLDIVASSYAKAGVADGTAGALSFLFANETSAQLALDARIEQLVDWRDGVAIGAGVDFTAVRQSRKGPIPASARPPGVTSTYTVTFANDPGERVYQEVWALRGPELVSVTWLGAPADKKLLSALAKVMRTPRETAAVGVDAAPAAQAALTRLAPPASMPAAVPSAFWLATKARSLATAGDAPGCVAAARAALTPPRLEGAEVVALAGIGCALEARDFDALAELGAGGPTARLEAASSLARAHQAGAGDALLKGVAFPAALAPVEARVRLELAVEQGRWAEVDAALADTRITHYDRIMAVVAAISVKSTPSREAARLQLCSEASALRLRVCHTR